MPAINTGSTSIAHTPNGESQGPQPVPAVVTAHAEPDPNSQLVLNRPRALPSGKIVSTTSNALVPAATIVVATQPSDNAGPPMFPGRPANLTDIEADKAALRFARAQNLRVTAVRDRYAYFSGIHSPIRLDELVFTSKRDRAWVRAMLNPPPRPRPWIVAPRGPPGFGLFQPNPEAYRVRTAPDPSHRVPLILDGPPGTFYRWCKFPPEIQTMIIQQAMFAPGINYFSLPTPIFDAPATNSRPRANRTCNSMRRHLRSLGLVSPQFAHVVNLVITQSRTKRSVDHYKKHPFNGKEDLVAFHVPGQHNWTRRHEDASQDGIYNAFGRGLKLVAIKYEPSSFPCSGPHVPAGPILPGGAAVDLDEEEEDEEDEDEEEGAPNPWGMVLYPDTPERCVGPCKSAMCRYVGFFRDAEVIYLMVYIRDCDILSAVKSRHEERSYMPATAQMLLDNQKGMPVHNTPKSPIACLLFLPFPLLIRYQLTRHVNLEKGLDRFNDSAFIWVELDRPTAEALVKDTILPAWDMATYLGRCKLSMMRRLPGKVNPGMEFKVLVTMHNLRWNQRYMR